MKHIWGIVPLLLLLLSALPALGQTLFWEDFEDGVADGFTVLAGGWEVVDGTYHVRNDGFEVYLASIAGSAEWSDYHFECDLRAVGSINQHVRFRMQDANNYYEVNVRANPYNDAKLQKVVNGSRSILATTSFPNANDEWHHFSIDVTGPDVLFKCDSTVLFNYFDANSPFLNGYIALASYSGGVVQWQDMYFDNVLIQVFAVPTSTATWSDVKTLYK